MGTNVVEGDVGDKVWCKETGGEKDRPGVVDDEVNGEGVEREGSLEEEGSRGKRMDQLLGVRGGYRSKGGGQ